MWYGVLSLYVSASIACFASNCNHRSVKACDVLSMGGMCISKSEMRGVDMLSSSPTYMLDALHAALAVTLLTSVWFERQLLVPSNREERRKE